MFLTHKIFSWISVLFTGLGNWPHILQYRKGPHACTQFMDSLSLVRLFWRFFLFTFVDSNVCRLRGLSPPRFVASEVCRFQGLSPPRFVTSEVCRLRGLSLPRFVASEVCRYLRLSIPMFVVLTFVVPTFVVPTFVVLKFVSVGAQLLIFVQYVQVLNYSRVFLLLRTNPCF